MEMNFILLLLKKKFLFSMFFLSDVILMIRDSSIEKKNHFSPFFFSIRNQKQETRLNKSVISNADRKSLEKEKNKKENQRQ